VRYLFRLFPVRCGLGLLAVGSSLAFADALADCTQSTDPDRQIRGCTAFIRQNPRNAGAYVNRSQAYLSKGDIDRALADTTRAIELNPKLAEAYSNRSWAHLQKGDIDPYLYR
jgi:tetratricopeptide (TPR) repeat protein